MRRPDPEKPARALARARPHQVSLERPPAAGRALEALRRPGALRPWLNNPRRALPAEAEGVLEELGFREAGCEAVHALRPEPDRLPAAKLAPGCEQVFTLRWVRGLTVGYAVWRREA